MKVYVGGHEALREDYINQGTQKNNRTKGAWAVCSEGDNWTPMTIPPRPGENESICT